MPVPNAEAVKEERRLLELVNPIVKTAIKAGNDSEEMYDWKKQMLICFIEKGRYKNLKVDWIWERVEARLEMMMDNIELHHEPVLPFWVLALRRNKLTAVRMAWPQIMDNRGIVLDQFSPSTLVHEIHAKDDSIRFSIGKHISPRFVAKARRGLREKAGDFARV